MGVIERSLPFFFGAGLSSRWPFVMTFGVVILASYLAGMAFVLVDRLIED